MNRGRALSLNIRHRLFLFVGDLPRTYNKGMSLTDQPTPGLSSGSREQFDWRRMLQYRLRTLLILSTILAALFGLLGRWTYKAYHQRQIVAAIHSAGGSVSYDVPRYWPKWLVDAMGVDHFANVRGVNLIGTTVTNADLERIRELTKLNVLYLGSAQITDGGLLHLKGMTSLQVLVILSAKNNVTDAGIEHLQGLTSLEELYLGGTKVTDSGVAHLKDLKALNTLWIHKLQVTDAYLHDLKDPTTLERGIGARGVYGSSDETEAHERRLKQLLPQCNDIMWDGPGIYPN